MRYGVIAMAAPKAKIQKLLDKRDQLQAELEALRNKIIGVELAITLLEGDAMPAVEQSPTRLPKTSVKPTLIDLLREVGASGLIASTAVEIAAKRGISLDRNTVSSLLSRLKRDGLVDYDGERYRLLEFAREQARAH